MCPGLRSGKDTPHNALRLHVVIAANRIVCHCCTDDTALLWCITGCHPVH
uniref:Uncharacterized protein n=1 Tax=Anguilla anguilla TaxID=7936 RepID=A0A0E9XN66_ANGAN